MSSPLSPVIAPISLARLAFFIVALVVVLGAPERAGRRDLGHDRPGDMLGRRRLGALGRRRLVVVEDEHR